MTGVFKPHMEILPPEQLRWWPELRLASKLGFALYGGTAIALRLGHRTSIDYDFFSEKSMDRAALHVAFPFLSQSTVLQDERNTLTILIPCSDSGHSQVKVSFFSAIDFGRVGEPDITNDGVMQVASFDDLLATKLKVVLQRAEVKDYRDIAALIVAGVNLSKGLAAAREIYGPNFQPSEGLKALVYFKDGDLSSLTKKEKDTLVKAASEVRELPRVTILSKQLTTSCNSLAIE